MKIHIDGPAAYSQKAPFTLNPGEFLQVLNRKFVMQTDGNLVLYDVQGTVTFASNTAWGSLNGSRVTFQADCNVVIYNSVGSVLWSSGTNRPGKLCSGGEIQLSDNLVFFTSTKVRSVAWYNGMGGSVPR